MIESLSAVKSVVEVIVPVTVDAVELLPWSVNVKVAAAEAVILALVIAVALTPVVEETKLNAAATSLASAPASILAVLVPKNPFTV